MEAGGYGSETMNKYTAVIKKEGEWWIGWIQEVPGVNCQEKKYGVLLESLKTTLSEAIEFNRADALIAAGDDYQEESIAV
jgi:predicted RNase H-like HicB family nuclease